MGAYSDRVIADGASYYWRLGEPSGTTAVAAVGGVNGTISGGVTLGQPGALPNDTNTAMVFNGTTGQIATSGPVVMVPPLSVEAWVRPSDLVGDRPYLTTHILPPYAQDTLTFQCIAGLPRCRILHAGDTGQSTCTDAIGPMTLGAWHHLVFVLSGGLAIKLYIDSIDRPLSAQLTMPLVGNTLQPALLGVSDWLGVYWGGALDEVAIYPRALTATEVATHYALTRQSVSWPGVPWWVQIAGDDALDSYNIWEPVTPSNTVDLPRGVSGGIWVGAGGDVAAVMQNGTMPVVLAAVPTGAWLPIAARRINATGTTATGLVALYET